ncbi:MAG: glycine zipper 2TM domain-containing protein [Candidatus Omnitrophica bacterium]|nr:glycine zipper 2TM domain-containing protein [Candidatus Omnitrophota bacterium]
MMKKFLLILCVILLVGCTTTQQGTTIGAVTGAGLGGIIGHQSGHGGTGAAIGGVVGALGGYAVGENMKAKFCPKCGRTFDESEKFCPYDGTELQYKQK